MGTTCVLKQITGTPGVWLVVCIISRKTYCFVSTYNFVETLRRAVIGGLESHLVMMGTKYCGTNFLHTTQPFLQPPWYQLYWL